MKDPIEWQLITAIAIAGALGAVLRYYCSLLQLPFGPESNTLFVNLIGSLLLGFLVGWSMFQTELTPIVKIAITTGFLGSFTTFSTFSLENAQLIQRSDWSMMFYNVFVQILLGILLATLGVSLGVKCSQ